VEPRKIQRVGSSTLAVSLPSEWVKDAGVKKGDLIYFEPGEEGALKLVMGNRMDRAKPSEVVEVYADQCTSPMMLSRILVGNYILGRDVMKVVSKDRLSSTYVDAIRSTLRGLMGIAIMEETPNHVVLQSSIDITQFPIHTLVRRLFIITSTMYNEAVESFFGPNLVLARDAMSRRNEADTMFWVIVRLLDSAQRDKVTATQINIPDSLNVLWFRVVAHSLWRMASWSEKIADKVLALEDNRKLFGDRLLSEVRRISDEAVSISHKAMNSLFSNDIELATNAIQEYEKIQQDEEALQERICSQVYLRGKSFSVTQFFKGKTAIEPCVIAQISFILWSIRRIAELGAEIADIAITKALSKQTKICNVTSD
jgi:phosphate uptake regulator